MTPEDCTEVVRRHLSVAATEYFNELIEDIDKLRNEPGAELANKADELIALLGRNKIQVLAGYIGNREVIFKVLHDGKEIT